MNVFWFFGFVQQVHVYVLHEGNLTAGKELQHNGPITDCAFSPDNQYLVASDANRRVILYRLPDFEVIQRVSHLLCIHSTLSSIQMILKWKKKNRESM